MHAILLVDHGSRRAAANAVLAELAALVQARVSCPVAIAHMELAPPSLDEAIASLYAQGVRSLDVHPYFLAEGRHATEDIPRLVREASEPHEGLVSRVSKPLGVHPLLAELVLLRLGELDVPAQCTK